MDSIFLPKKILPSHDELFVLAEKAGDVLDSESASYRPKDEENNSGSLLDFTNDKSPVIVVPDLHARPYFIKNLLDFKIKPELEFLNVSKEETVFSALEKGLLRIVCVGDALHTEKITVDRWNIAYNDFKLKNYTSDAMKEEMTDGLSLVMMLMNLKIAFPEHFHFLKGNHENILNRTGNGDFSFKKYAEEGRMVKCFMDEYYGEDVLYLMSLCETLLPLVYLAPNCIVSHAEPAIAFSRDEIINARLYGGIIEGLTWTNNDDAEDGSVQTMIENLLPKSEQENSVYIGGHRPVNGNYKLRQNGSYIQIHNPLEQNVAFVRTYKKFNPDEDIICVDKNMEAVKWQMNSLQ